MKNEKIELSIDDLKVRDKIIKALESVDMIAIYTPSEGSINYRAKDFDFKGTLHDFDRIMNSIYKYNRKNDTWLFLLNKIEVSFSI